MIALLVQWFLSTLLLLAVAFIAPGFDGTLFSSALIGSALIGLLNAALGVLFRLVRIPFSILTHGIFLVVVNGLIILVVARLLEGFEVHGFLPAFWGAILLGMLGMVVRAVTEKI